MEMNEQREQSQACLNSAEAQRWRATQDREFKEFSEVKEYNEKKLSNLTTISAPHFVVRAGYIQRRD